MVQKHNLLGAWAFLIGVVLAIVIGVFNAQLGNDTATFINVLLVIIGILVGLLNVGSKDITTFLFAGIALVIVSNMGQSSLNVIPVVGDVFSALLTIFVPATVIVALKAVFSVARD